MTGSFDVDRGGTRSVRGVRYECNAVNVFVRGTVCFSGNDFRALSTSCATELLRVQPARGLWLSLAPPSRHRSSQGRTTLGLVGRGAVRHLWAAARESWGPGQSSSN